MLTGVLLTLAVLALLGALLTLLVRAWLGERGIVAQRVKIELTEREAERQIQHIAYAAMQKLMDEARRSSDRPL
jgi:type II secretory pathway pseudopilin PulG